MEDEARWMIKNNLTTEKQVPDFMNYIYADGLKAIKPEAVKYHSLRGEAMRTQNTIHHNHAPVRHYPGCYCGVGDNHESAGRKGQRTGKDGR